MTKASTLAVDGMTCDGCENNVEFALGAIKGVTAVAADHSAGTVTIEFDPLAVEEPALGEAIESMGYTWVR